MATTSNRKGSGGGAPSGPAGGDLGGTYPDPTVAKASASFALAGVLTPATLAAGNNNDYNPASLATSTILRLTPHAQGSTLTSLAGGATGRVIVIKNVDTVQRLLITDDDAAGTAANRFDIPNGTMVLEPGEAQAFKYDATANRWTTLGAYNTDYVNVALPLLEEFIGGSTESGEVGDYGWAFTNYAFNSTNATAGRFGVVQLLSSASIGVINHVRVSPTAGNGKFRQDQWQRMMFIFAPVGAARDFDMRAGLMTDPTVNPPTDGVYIEALAADTNWFVVTRAGGVQTRTDSGVAVALGTFVRWQARKNGTDIDMYVNGAFVLKHAANIPAGTVTMNAAFQQIPTAANARSIDLDACIIMPIAAAR